MHDSDNFGTFTYVIQELGKRKLAFVFVRDPLGPDHYGRKLKDAFGGVLITNEGYTVETAEDVINRGEADAVAFGKLLIANPDLPKRFAKRAALNVPVPESFYADSHSGYTDYPQLSGD